MSGLAVAALAIGVFTLVAAVAAWGIVLIATRRADPGPVGGFAYTPLNQPADFLPLPSYPDFGALAATAWFAVLPTASVGLVLVRAARHRHGSADGLRTGTSSAVVALALAIAGLVLLHVVLR